MRTGDRRWRGAAPARRDPRRRPLRARGRL